MSLHDGYAAHITWDKPGLPDLVGPFATRDEAHEWCRLNVPNGSYEVWPLAWPYLVRAALAGDQPSP